jgi:hypothetical protein
MSNGLCCAFGNWKINKWRRFVNTIAPWPMPVRQSLRNLPRCGAFISAYTSENLKMTFWRINIFSWFRANLGSLSKIGRFFILPNSWFLLVGSFSLANLLITLVVLWYSSKMCLQIVQSFLVVSFCSTLIYFALYKNLLKLKCENQLRYP